MYSKDNMEMYINAHSADGCWAPCIKIRAQSSLIFHAKRRDIPRLLIASNTSANSVAGL